VEGDAELAVAWRELANCRIRLGEFGAAVEALRRYLELRPDDAAARHDLGVAERRIAG
jgi:Flp pilus assembly protein TadD